MRVTRVLVHSGATRASDWSAARLHRAVHTATAESSTPGCVSTVDVKSACPCRIDDMDGCRELLVHPFLNTSLGCSGNG